jgi:YbgC/YbaW family acyl-CoA thioester hydrolase
MPHRYELDVRFYELDPYNHVNHAVYFQYFETARVALLAEAGYTLQAMQEAGMIWVVTELTARFLKPAQGGDHLMVETEVGDIGRVTSTWRQRILREDEVLVRQELLGAITNSGGRPVRLPEPMRDALETYRP